MDALPHWDLSSLIFLAELLNSNFLSLSATHKNSVSFLELFIAIYDTQSNAITYNYWIFIFFIIL